MNYLEDYVIYYNVWLSRNIPFYKINYFQKAQVDNNYTKDHDRWRSQFNTNYRYDLITTVYGWLYWNRYHLRMVNLAKSRSFYVEFYIFLAVA